MRTGSSALGATNRSRAQPNALEINQIVKDEVPALTGLGRCTSLRSEGAGDIDVVAVDVERLLVDPGATGLPAGVPTGPSRFYCRNNHEPEPMTLTLTLTSSPVQVGEA